MAEMHATTLETMHREIDEIKGNVEKILVILESKPGFDEEGALSGRALKELAGARGTPKGEYVPHAEVEKWLGKSSGRQRRSRR